MPFDIPDFDGGGGGGWDEPNFAGTVDSDPAVGRVDSAIDGRFTGIAPPAPGDEEILNQMRRQTQTSTRAPTGTAGLGTTILDSITGVGATLAKAGIANLAGKILKQASAQPGRQGPTGRPITDPQAGNSPTISVLGVPIALHAGQLQKIQAGQPFNLTQGQRSALGAQGVNFAGKNLVLQSNGTLAKFVNGQTVPLSAQDTQGGGGDDKTTVVLYFALAAGVAALLFWGK